MEEEFVGICAESELRGQSGKALLEPIAVIDERGSGLGNGGVKTIALGVGG